MKAPAFQFYPEDWLSNTKLAVCPVAAHGLLINMMCYMHQSEKYGYLLINGVKPDHKTIIKLLRMNHRSFIHNLSILLENGVIKQDDEGVYFCRRMIDDQHLRDIRRASGSKGGTQRLLNQKSKQKSTPSSSSTSTTTSTKKKDAASAPNKRKYGAHKNVLLTAHEHKGLVGDYGESATGTYIDRLDEYIGIKGAKYKSHYLVIKKWMRTDGINPVQTNTGAVEIATGKWHRCINAEGSQYGHDILMYGR
jgi:hypothetical protein